MSIGPWLILALVSCRVAGSRTLWELNLEQTQRLCEEFGDREAAVFTCSGVEIVLAPRTVDECVAEFRNVGFACDTTVREVRDCEAARAAIASADVCDPEFQLPESCAFQFREACVIPPTEYPTDSGYPTIY